jgi:hypothetical protein
MKAVVMSGIGVPRPSAAASLFSLSANSRALVPSSSKTAASTSPLGHVLARLVIPITGPPGHDDARKVVMRIFRQSSGIEEESSGVTTRPQRSWQMNSIQREGRAPDLVARNCNIARPRASSLEFLPMETTLFAGFRRSDMA